MHTVEIALVLLLIVAVGGALVRWTHIGLPIFLVVTGAVASLLPGLDRVSIDPELFLLLFIPPLLYADARSLPRRDLLRVLQPVLLLALGLVVLTVVVGYTLHWLVPSMPLAVAFTPGAIVTPTDAVAVGVLVSWLGRKLCERLIHRYEGKIALREADAAAADAKADRITAARKLRLAGIQAERELLSSAEPLRG